MSQFAQVTLVSPGGAPIRTLVESALHSELKMIQLSLAHTERNLQAFEIKYNMNTSDFYRRLTDGEIQETLDFIEWVGEYKTLTRLQKKYRDLQEIQFAD
ncbi:MAG: hypothetical protein JW850_15315 [Thermoflexales bacterium]|nr:hypothetical protein [Thermoflexales bacterium]